MAFHEFAMKSCSVDAFAEHRSTEDAKGEIVAHKKIVVLAFDWPEAFDWAFEMRFTPEQASELGEKLINASKKDTQ